MKKFQLLILSVICVSFIAALAGCNDETVPDPEIAKSRDDQRRAMDPSKMGGGTPAAPSTSGH